MLTDTQRAIVELIRDGCDSDEAAETLGISRWTMRDHIRRLRELLGADSIHDLPEALDAREGAGVRSDP